MIGDFELPGDENARNGKVGGGPQTPGQQQQNQSGQNGGGMPMGLPQAGGGGGQSTQEQQAAKQGGGGDQSQQNQNGSANQIAGASDPNAKPEGMQVSQLGGEASGEQQGGGAGEKPPSVAIGDSAMRIQTAANAPGVVGAQQQASNNTQQHEKGTGTGGKGPTGGPGNNRVEKGRAIPAGL